NALVAGFGGFRDFAGAWSFDPRLPRDWEYLRFRLTLQGTRLLVTVRHYEIAFDLETGPADSIDVVVEGAVVTVPRGETTTVHLTGVETRTGRPSLRDIEGAVREDGSIITATVPSHPELDGDSPDAE
ncbi:MAG: glycoside hydrolase family 65 protein, partial [Salana multivorans]|nr:glycoside hydrolase family 65 protein [Salana multivorans]